jgi:hypothetical protein
MSVAHTDIGNACLLNPGQTHMNQHHFPKEAPQTWTTLNPNPDPKHRHSHNIHHPTPLSHNLGQNLFPNPSKEHQRPLALASHSSCNQH